MKKLENNYGINSSYIVYKSNELISAKSDLMDALESKILLTALSKCDANPNSIDTVTFDIIEYCKLAKVKSNCIYENISKACRNLVRRGVFLKLTETKEKSYSWVSDAECEFGKVSITINPTIKTLVSFRKNVPYTKYLLRNILFMNSKYSIRLYEIVKQFKIRKYKIISLKELREMIGLTKEYKAYKLFRVKVLEVACGEINKLSDIKVKYEPIKTGRRITDIKFYIDTNNDLSEFDNLEKQNIIEKIVKHVNMSYGFNLKKSLLTKYHRIVLIDLLKAVDSGFTCKIESEGFFYYLLKTINEKYALDGIEDY